MKARMIQQPVTEPPALLEDALLDGEPDRTFPAAVLAILAAPDALEVFRLDPEQAENAAGPGLFHGHRVLGTALVRVEADRREVGRALVEGNRSPIGPMLCLDPHYGVRASRGGKSAEVLICFPCFSAAVIGPDGQFDMYSMGRSAERVLRCRLRKAGVGWLWYWRRWLS